MTRFSIWQNDRKSDPKHPDGRGHLEIDCTLIQELAAAMAQGQGMTQDVKGNWIFRLDAAAWRSDGQNPKAPVMSGSISTLAQTQEQAAKLAAWKASQNGGGGGAAGWGAPPAAAPPYAPQAPAAPPAPAYAPPAPPAAPAYAPPAPAAPAAPAAAPAPGGWGAPAAPAYAPPAGF